MGSTMNEDAKEQWVVLFRFGKQQHLEQLRDRGAVYMNPHGYFARLDDPVRGDPFEGADRIIQSKALKRLTIESAQRKVKLVPAQLRGPLRVRLGTFSCNVYCTFGVTETAGFAVDERCFEFGDLFVIVLNTQAFINRLDAAANARNMQLEYGFVEYYDADVHSGETGPFRKAATFAYQNEFRFIIQPGSHDPIELELGSLRDITSDIFPLSKINDLIEWSA